MDAKLRTASVMACYQYNLFIHRASVRSPLYSRRTSIGSPSNFHRTSVSLGSPMYWHRISEGFPCLGRRAFVGSPCLWRRASVGSPCLWRRASVGTLCPMVQAVTFELSFLGKPYAVARVSLSSSPASFPSCRMSAVGRRNNHPLSRSSPLRHHPLAGCRSYSRPERVLLDLFGLFGEAAVRLLECRARKEAREPLSQLLG